MGWWSTNKTGASFTENPGGPEMLWGDAPADIFGDAIDGVILAFETEVQRRPTKDEVRAGLEFSLGVFDDTMRQSL